MGGVKEGDVSVMLEGRHKYWNLWFIKFVRTKEKKMRKIHKSEIAQSMIESKAVITDASYLP